MKFNKHLLSNVVPEFDGHYIEYGALKQCIKRARQELAETGAASTGCDERVTSMSVARPKRLPHPEQEFYDTYQNEVKRVGECITVKMSAFEKDLEVLIHDVSKRDTTNEAGNETLLNRATALGERFIAIEKYVNLNLMGLHKILKKHDKNLPHAPCRQFYQTVLHKESWISGDYSYVFVKLSGCFSELRGDKSGARNEDPSQGFIRSTTKFWVENCNVSAVKYAILQHLPVFNFKSDGDDNQGDSQLVNSVYFDNSSAELYHGRLDKRPDAIAVRMRWYGNDGPREVYVERKTHRDGWKGEMSVKQRFRLPESKVLEFLDGSYTIQQAREDLLEQGETEATVNEYCQLFAEVQRVVDSKQLRPMIRTQYMRTAFQIPFDATVRVSLDTNLMMIKESVDDVQNVDVGPRWYRDPDLKLNRDDITSFPHSVLELKLSLPEGTFAPSWVQELLASGMCTEINKFSKFIHGTCTLFPDMVRSVPYWVDDVSVRRSMIASAPRSLDVPLLDAANREAGLHRSAAPLAPTEHHPVLGTQPTLELIGQARAQRADGMLNFGLRQRGGDPRKPSFFDRIIGADKPRALSTSQAIEPKTYFANERTFLNWLHMAVTIGSIAAALLGFSSAADRSSSLQAEAVSVEIICMILLPVAVILCFYALYLFLWRSHQISFKKNDIIDDPRGPLVLTGVVMLALGAIFVLSVKDLVDTMSAQGQSAQFVLAALWPAVFHAPSP